jgi:predicted transcriptional regulator
MSRAGYKPTAAELQILAALWPVGTATVRQVHQQLGTSAGYTTTLKLMQIMTTKGLLLRERKGRQHVYRPAVSMEKTQRHLVADLLHKAFGGSLARLMVAALSSEKATRQELEQIRALIDQANAASGEKGGSSP